MVKGNPAETLTEAERRAVIQMLKAFYETHRVTGTFVIKYGARELTDSGLEELIDVYFADPDERRASEYEYHMQYLSTMVPVRAIAYQYLVRIDDSGGEPEFEILKAEPPEPVSDETG